MNNTSPRDHGDDAACELRELPLISSVMLICLSTLSGLTALLGNALVVLAIHRTTTLRIASNYFIASLAVADFSVGLLMYPVLIAKVSANIWQGEHWLSKTADFLWMQTTTTTTFNLCAVSLDRYIAITAVFKYHRIVTKKKSLKAIAFIWTFSFIFASLRLFVTSATHYSKLWIATTLLTVVLPLIIVGICYYRIYREAKTQSRKIAKNCLGAEEAAISTKNRKAAWTAAIIIGLFVVFWLPSLIASVVELMVTQPCQRAKIDYAWFWIAVLSFSSSAFNPWVYTIRIQEFRNTMRRIIFCRAGGIPARISEWEISRETSRRLSVLYKLPNVKHSGVLELQIDKFESKLRREIDDGETSKSGTYKFLTRADQ